MAEFTIDEFPNDDQFWRIDGIGKVSRNPYVDSEPRVQVLFSALISEGADPLKKRNIKSDTHRQVWVGIGQLPLISIGSVWHKKSLVSIVGGPGNGGKVANFDIDTQRIKPFKAKAHHWKGAIVVEDKAVRCLPPQYYSVGKNFKYLADSFLWVYPVIHDLCSVVLIPSYEILRSYYLSSNKVARAVFENDIGLLIDTNESEILDDGTAYLSLLKTTDDHDSWFIARWLASEKTQKQIDAFNRSIVTASANATPYSHSVDIGAHVNIDFPFDGITKLRAAGKYIKLYPFTESEKNEKEIWGFLVFNIQSCTHPMPFTNVVSDRKNDGRQGSNSNDPSLPISAFPKQPLPDQMYSDVPLNLASSEEPDKSQRAILHETFKARFTDLAGKELIRDPKLTQHYRSARKTTPVVEDFPQQGTGEGTSGETSSGMANVRQQSVPFRAKLPADLATFMEVVKRIRNLTQSKGCSVTTIEVNGRGQAFDGEEIITCFRTRIQGCVSWHLISQYPVIPRAIIVAKIASAAGVNYILEMERKKDKHCTLILYTEDHIAVSDAVMDLFLATTAKNNGWPSPGYLPYLKRIKVHHHGNRTVDAFAKAILTKINLN